jgi:uncharacterized phage protein (TIGR02218 family)
MKPFSRALAALFDTNEFVSCDLYTFTLLGGGTAALTSADHPILWNGVTYQPVGPVIDRSAISQKTGLEVSQVKITLYPTASDMLEGITWLSACNLGYLDGASVTIQRAFAPNWQAGITGTILMMAGRVGDVTVGRSKIEIEVNSWTEILTNQMPRQYYQSPCRFVLFDTRCGVARYSYDVEVGAEIAPVAFNVTNPGNFPENWFAYGTVTMLTGAAAGQTRSILFSQATGPNGLFLQLTVPLTVTPAYSDVVQLTPGCDKQLSTCQNKFNNVGRFGGFPYIPAPEVAL